MMLKTSALVLLLAVAASADISTFDGAYAADLKVDTPADGLSTRPRLATTATADPLAASLCPKGYKLVWNDEFDNTASLQKWNYELYNGCDYGICGWGNSELEWYTNRTDNANVALGKLVITARKTTTADRRGCCQNGACKTGECQFTSARLRTYKKFSIAPTTKTGQKTVRIAARMKVPTGKGLWGAIWMLPEASPANCSGCGTYGTWASSGAITIAQSINSPKQMLGGIAYGGPFPNQVFSNYNATLKNPTDYHEYVLEWSRKQMTWYIDGKFVHTAKSSKGGSVTNGWFTSATNAGPDSPFDRPFHLLVNLATGGNPTGATKNDVANTLKKPKNMQLDYIRVCQA